MARFDVHEIEDGTLVVVCQAALLDHLDVRFVTPLIAIESAPDAAGRLNPIIEIDGRRYLAFPQWSGGMPTRLLGRRTANIESQGLAILNAFDMLFSGF